MAKSDSTVGAKLKCLVCEDKKKVMKKYINTSKPQLHRNVPNQKAEHVVSIYTTYACTKQ